jgi:hypothetical protein
MYFWENSVDRAENFGKELLRRKKLKEYKVVGAALNLGLCLDLLDSASLALLREMYGALEDALQHLENQDVGGNGDLLLRNLDCAVINALHAHREENQERPFDSVRGVFWEGEELYPGAGFKDKNHIQLCIRNPNCIKGFFWPQKENRKHSAV